MREEQQRDGWNEEEEGHTEVREEQQRDGWNEEEEYLDRRMRERLEERICMTSELDVDDDGDDDDGNNIGESDTMDGDEVSDARSRNCKASCIRMFDREDVKDHRLKVHELEKVETEMF